MRIIGQGKIDKFKKKHPKSIGPLDSFVTVVKSSAWKNFVDIRNTFNSVDVIGSNLYCFDISGNNYRLIAKVKIKDGVMDIIEVMTHAEYDKWNKKNK